MTDLGWLWDKYSDKPPENPTAEDVHMMRQDIFFLKGIIEGMQYFIKLKGEKT